MKKCPPFALLAAMLLLASGGIARADSLQVAVAANFTAAFKQLAPLFEQQTGHRLIPSFGATGQLYAQIRHGAPFDVFLAADDEAPGKLLESGDALANPPVVYARGRLVLWSATAGMVDDRGAVLRHGDFARLAIANPKTAPYGRAAIDTLDALGLVDQLRPRFVQGESIAQTFQFAASGNAALGFVALGQVMTLPPAGRGSHWLVPADLHRPIDQAAVVLRRAKNPRAGQALLDFLTSPDAALIIQGLGYETPALP
ncbi:MAG: molybdate ABC transporter substrate-binding protein [Porticoccaceae bacterium]|jgi:molybdate transport system substrate-binding protein|nr:molybdate ABC transporter substrate-binding protein [Porticoccaceae bacterium]HLS98165.1 molybdate ABC transporter substrate-binding protein [Porticoccaceae bacterium]